MPRRREVLIFGAVGAAAAAAGVFFGPLALQSNDGAAELLASVYPDASGIPVAMKGWEGRVVVVNFWATWCEPCREEIPMLVGLRKKYAGNGAEVVGISIDQAAKVQQFAKSFGVTYPLLIAEGGGLDTMRKLGNKAGALPFTVVLDRTGMVAYRKLGLLRLEELEPVLAGLLR